MSDGEGEQRERLSARLPIDSADDLLGNWPAFKMPGAEISRMLVSVGMSNVAEILRQMNDLSLAAPRSLLAPNLAQLTANLSHVAHVSLPGTEVLRLALKAAEEPIALSAFTQELLSQAASVDDWVARALRGGNAASVLEMANSPLLGSQQVAATMAALLEGVRAFVPADEAEEIDTIVDNQSARPADPTATFAVLWRWLGSADPKLRLLAVLVIARLKSALYVILVGVAANILYDRHIKPWLEADPAAAHHQLAAVPSELQIDMDHLRDLRVVVARRLNVRQNGSAKSRVLGRLDRGDVVLVEGHSGDWRQVRRITGGGGPRLEGWVHRRYLRRFVVEHAEQ